jgi:hypothetical protein
VSKDQELLLSAAATLKRVFPAVAVLPIGRGNRMLLAFSHVMPEASIRARLEGYEGNAFVMRMAASAAARISQVDPSAGTIVFTDDFAPVEYMTRRMLNSGRFR